MKTKLYCLPYAGGTSKIFSSWTAYLNPQIEFVPLELSGRGNRMFDELYENRGEAVEDTLSMIKEDILNNNPYMIFGHSLGALIAYELVQKIRALQFPSPLHIFFSGSSAPHLRSDAKKFSLLNDIDFKKEVLNLGGTPSEFFENPELMEIFLPLLKNDFKLAEEQIKLDNTSPLNQDITVFFGTEDELTKGKCEGWKEHTHAKCHLYPFVGGHFFLNDQQEKLVGLINKMFSKDQYKEH
ncbi:thioesterase II family protein [Tenacibaculum agarivorans]|uniref:thioesterase II family protein n=1 Tax=Tenacibaculum agarivorans TaxID=1908389 RepID=UPI00094BC24A|nr:thioesterase domain-containing protein [Tenacibaculum agarivorans]